MKSLSVLLLLLCATLFFPWALHAEKFPAPTASYSADTQMQVNQAGGVRAMTIPGKVFFADGSERREATVMGHQSIIIRNRAKGTYWILLPEQRMYMEGSGLDQPGKDPAEAWENSDVSMEKVGPEQVNGIDSVKYRVSARQPDGATSEGFVWLTQKNIPVKFDIASTSSGQTTRITMVASNLAIGPQDPSLFKIPPGYSKLQMHPTGTMEMPKAPQGTMQPDAPGPAAIPEGMTPEDWEQMQKQMRDALEQMQKQKLK